jgi:branched-chain amino acid transport system substrate-binding protein
MENVRLGKLAAASLVALLLAGCGGGAAGGGEGEAVKIGLPHPLTGAWAEGGKNSVNGAKLALEDINKGGGVEALGGAQLEGVEADTSSDDPGQAASVTRRLVERDEVSALVGSYVSALSLTASTEAEKAGIPMLTQAFTDELTSRGYKHLFQLPPPSSEIGAATVPYVTDAFAASGTDLQRVAVISSNDAALKAQAEGTVDAAEEAGLQVVAKKFYPIDLTDASVLARQGISGDPQLVFLGGPTQAAILVVEALRSIGFDGPIVGLGGGGILNKGFASALNDNVDGVLSMAAWNWDMPYEGLDDVSKRYEERFGEPFMPQEAGESYAAVWLIKEAMESAASSDPADIAQTLRELEQSSGPSSFMPGGQIAFNDEGLNPDTFPVLIQWQDTKPRSVWPKEVQAVDPIS